MPETSQFSPVSLTAGLPIDSILLIIFLCLLAGYIVYTVILHYHWSQYSASNKTAWWTYVVFAFTSLPLLTTVGLIALTY